MDPLTSAAGYDRAQLGDLFQEVYRPEHMDAILEAVDPADISSVTLTDDEFADLMAFLESLTSASIGELTLRGLPDSVPSGLPLAD